MSDFRFKISGNTEPFTVNLYKDGNSNIVSSQVIEYSGETKCVIFSNLNENTDYYATIIDAIGNTTNTATLSTPANPVVIPQDINFNLSGDVLTPDGFDYSVLGGVNEIVVDPPLESGQEFNVTLSGTTFACSNDVSTIKLYKRCGFGNPNQLVEEFNSSTPNGTYSFNLKYGDSISYNMSSSITHVGGNGECSIACSKLNIDSISGLDGNTYNITCGPQTELITHKDRYTQITTTAAPAPDPTIIQLYNCSSTSINGDPLNSLLTAEICADPPLNAGQSFRLGVQLTAGYEYSTLLRANVCSYSKLDKPLFFNFQSVDSRIDGTTNGPKAIENSDIYYVDINSSNINDFKLCVNVRNDNLNYDVTNNVYGIAQLNSISNMVGGQYEITSHLLKKSISRSISQDQLTGGGTGGITGDFGDAGDQTL